VGEEGPLCRAVAMRRGKATNSESCSGLLGEAGDRQRHRAGIGNVFSASVMTIMTLRESFV
jgi:hypothetical protein